MQDVIDLNRFPIHQPGSAAYVDLVGRCKADLRRDGMFSLEGFMYPQVAQQVADDTAQDMASSAFHHKREHNIYFDPDMADLATDHPALKTFQTSNFTLCADQVEDTAVTRTYEYAPLRAFLADVMEKPALFMMDDPLGRLNVMSYGAGDGLNWHFDRSEFTVTLLLQAPEAGGVFEYRTGLRSKADPNYDGVGRLLAGHDLQVRQVGMQPGTLNVFLGVNTAHRVTPVEGTRRRVMAVLSYYETPGVAFSEAEQRGFYGRTA